MTQTDNRADSIHTQIRNYDLALVEWIRDDSPLKQDGKLAPVVFATPDRAFSEMGRILQGDRPTKVIPAKNIPLPFISIERNRLQFDQTRFRGPNTEFRKIAVSPDSLTTYNTQFPLPYDITYRVNVWAKTREVLNAFQIWSMLKFRNGFETFISVDFRSVWEFWGSKSIPFENGGIMDASELEPDEGHRILRFQQELTAKGWFTFPLERVPAVAEIRSDVYLVEDTGVDLTIVTGTEVDANPQTYTFAYRNVIDEDGNTVEDEQ